MEVVEPCNRLSPSPFPLRGKVGMGRGVRFTQTANSNPHPAQSSHLGKQRILVTEQTHILEAHRVEDTVEVIAFMLHDARMKPCASRSRALPCWSKPR